MAMAKYGRGWCAIGSFQCVSHPNWEPVLIEWHHTQVSRSIAFSPGVWNVTRRQLVWYGLGIRAKIQFHARKIKFITLLNCLVSVAMTWMWQHSNALKSKWFLVLWSVSVQLAHRQLISSRWHWMKMVLSSSLVILASSSVSSLFLAKNSRTIFSSAAARLPIHQQSQRVHILSW